MIDPPSVFNHCDSGSQEPRSDALMTRREHKPPTATSSGKSRSVASYATERRSLEHASDHTTHCHNANKLATQQQATKLAQPPFATKPAKCCDCPSW